MDIHDFTELDSFHISIKDYEIGIKTILSSSPIIVLRSAPSGRTSVIANMVQKLRNNKQSPLIY